MAVPPRPTSLVGAATNGSYLASVIYPNNSHLVDVVVDSTAEFTLPVNVQVDVIASLPRFPSSINLAYVGISSLSYDLAVDANSAPVMSTHFHNALSTIANVHFPTKLSVLDVSYNELERIGRVNPLPTKSDSTALAELYLDHNRIKSIQDAEFPPGLQILDLSFNSVTSVADVKWPLALERLRILDHNSIADLTYARFPSSLIHLSIEANNFTTYTVNLPPRLQTFSLGRNDLTSLYATAAQFDRLEQLDNFTVSGRLQCAGNLETRMLWNVLPICIIPAETTVPTRITADAAAVGAWVYVLLGLVGVTIFAILMLLVRRAKQRRALEDHEAAYGKLSDTAFLVQEIRIDQALRRRRVPYSCIQRGALVAKGGFGVVHVATLTRGPDFVPVTVALKSLRPERMHELRAVQAFVDEIRLGASLQHPHIVGFVGIAFASAHNPSVVMEYMARGDLWTVLTTEKHFVWGDTPGSFVPSKEAVCLDIVRGLVYLHEEVAPVVIHRDLKSKNVLLNDAYTAKLSDFGTSREFGPHDHVLTAEVGTVPWIAPEVLKGTRYSEKADIYSFGVLLSELDTHQVPYFNQIVPLPVGGINVALTKARIAMMVAANELRPSFSGECPAAILVIADKCLRHDPADRPTARELQELLTPLVQATPAFASLHV
ncbi:protein kinase [Achlya hypogyna]|uniref:Protein kinase n=1 Tax=Achlya hypogyna TaxID=1202772 RepID=A0A1V9Z473_ACHHY|nr:protein kinase [Achlya hypogyna]